MRRIIVIFGMPYSGKSTVCDHLYQRLQTEQIRIDQIWLELFEKPDYSPAQAGLVFNELLSKLKARLVKCDENLVVEGVFASEERLNKIKELANDFGYTYLPVLLVDTIKNLKKKRNAMSDKGAHPGSEDVIDFFAARFQYVNNYLFSIHTGQCSIEQTFRLIDSIL